MHAALRRLTRDVTTEAAASALIRRLDSDNDGEVSVAQLERFLDAYAARLARADSEVTTLDHKERSRAV